jgi:subtilase family serine protease
VKEVLLPAQPPRTGELLTVGVVVENAGDLDANASTVMIALESSANMTLLFSDSPMAVPPVPAGQAVTVNVSGDTARFTPGTYTLVVTVDYGNDVAESNESNNRLSDQLTILEPEARAAVLSVGEIFFAGDRVEGKKVDIIVAVSNTGNDVALDVRVSFVIDGKTAATQNLDQIAAGTSRNATLTWTFSGGDHSVRVQVSSAGLQDVSGERKVSVASGAQDQSLLILAIGLGLIVILVGVAVAVRLRSPPGPGPKVKLVEEEE